MMNARWRVLAEDIMMERGDYFNPFHSAIEAKQLSLFQTFFPNIKEDNTTTTENLNISMINRSNLAVNESS